MGLTGWMIFTGVILVLGALAAWLLSRPSRREQARRTEVTQRLAAAQRREDGRAVVGEALRKPPHVVPPARVNTTPRPRQTPAAVPDSVDFTSPTSYPGGSAYTAGAWHGHHGPAASGAEAGGSIGHSGGHHSSHDSGSSSGGYDGGSSGGYDSGSSGGGDSGGSW